MALSYSCRLMKTSISLAASPRLEGRGEGRRGQSSSSEQNPTEFKFPAETQRQHWGTCHAGLQSPLPWSTGLWLVAGPQAAFGGSHIQVELVVGSHNRPPAGPSVWRLKTSWLAPTDARRVLGVPLCGLPALSWGFLDSSLAASLLLWWEAKPSEPTSFPLGRSRPGAPLTRVL